MGTVIHSYAPSTLRGPDRHRLTKAACICGLIPLVVGIGCFVGWALLGWEFFVEGGFITIWGGLLLFAAGSICLLIDYILRISRQTPADRRWLPNRRQWAAFGLLVINFPAVIAVIASVGYLNSFYVVTVDNQSSTVVQELLLHDPEGWDILFTAIPPGKKVRSHERIAGLFSSCLLTQNQTIASSNVAFTAKPYRTEPHDLIVTIHPDLSVSEVETSGPNERAHLP